MRLSKLIAAAAIAVLPLGAMAEPYVLDKSHAHVTFQVGHLGFSTTHGQFREFDADISFDPANVEATTVSFTIQTASVDTFWEPRDKHLRNKDFFDVENHPTITFVSTSVVPTGAETADVTGDLTILGVTQSVTMQAKLNKLGESPFQKGKQIAGFTVTGEIDRTAFGMNFAAPAVSAIIPIQVDLEMSPAG